MISVTHSDPYNSDATGKPATVTRYGTGIRAGRRTYGWHPGGQPIVDDTGADGADTIAAVMYDTGALETFDVAQVEVVVPE